MSDQITKDLGGITAYAAAVAAGYTGTKAQFETLMASYATVAQNAAASASAAADSEENAEAWAVGERGGTPVSSGDDTYNNNAKYWAEQAEDFADSIDPDKIESHIDAAYIKETASGSIATLSDGAPAPVRNLIAEIVPLQSGSGDPSPSNVRAISGWTEANISVSGINVWDEEWELGSYNTSTGAKSINNNCIRSKNMIPVKGGETYTIIGGYSNSCCYDEGGDFISITPYRATGEYGKYYLDIPNNAYYITFYMPSSYGTTYNNDISINYPSTDHDYHAYNGETHTISFASAGTVYGGRLDVTSGVLTVEWGGVNIGGENWTYSPSPNEGFYCDSVGAKPAESVALLPNAISSIFKVLDYNEVFAKAEDNIFGVRANGGLRVYTSLYTDASTFKTAMNGQIIAFELATPQTYQLTPTEVKTLLKNNNIWADTGDVTVEYVADTKTFIENLVNA